MGYFIRKVLFLSFFISFICSYGFTQTNSEMPEPPVNIELNLPEIVHSGELIEIKLNIIPSEDMHLDVGILLPKGIIPVGGGFMLKPYQGRNGEL